VAVHIQLAGTGLAKVRFAISPVFETVMALDSLSSPGAVHLPWARWAQPLLGPSPTCRWSWTC
jgi:hypothetical protein